MKTRAVFLSVILLLLMLLLPVAAGAVKPISTGEIAGTWEAVAYIEQESTIPDFTADFSVPITLKINGDGTGSITVHGINGALTYQNGVIIAQVTSVEDEYTTHASFKATASREDNWIIIAGNLTARLEGYSGIIGVWEWSAKKQALPVAGEDPEENDEDEDIPVLTGPEQEWDDEPGQDVAPGGEYEPAPVPRGEQEYDWNWDFECDCEDPKGEHSGPLATAVISIIAAVAATMGGAIGGATGGVAAGSAGYVTGETGAGAVPQPPDSGGFESIDGDGPDSTVDHGREEADTPPGERDSEPVDDYLPSPETGYGGPDDNPYTNFQGGKGPGDCVKYGLPNYWVNTATLNLVVQDRFFTCGGLGPQVDLTLNYNSASAAGGTFGLGWSFSYDWFLEVKGNIITIVKGSGQGIGFATTPGASSGQPVEARPLLTGVFHRLLDYGDYWFYMEKGSRVYHRFDRVPGLNQGRLTAIIDYYGNILRLNHGTQGNLETITDAAGRNIVFTFNERNLCTAFLLPDGRQASFYYDGKGRLIRTEDLMKIAVDYEYDSGNSLTRMIVGRNRRTLSFHYRQAGGRKLLQTVTDANGKTTFYKLLANSPCRVEQIDPEGNKTLFQSRAGLTEAVISPLGETATVEYRDRLPVKQRDRNGGEICWEYDREGRRLKEIDPSGEEIRFLYDPFGNLIQITDSLGGNWRYRYNDKNSLIGITSPAGRSLSLAYNDRGQVISLTGFDGLRTCLDYDRFGNVIKATGPSGGITAFAYDEQGYFLATVTDELGHSAHYEHDGNGRLLKHRHPDGTEKSLVFDCCYSLLATDERGLNRGYERDANGNIIKEIDAASSATELVYDGNNKLISYRDRGGHLTNYLYDQARRLKRITNALGFCQEFSYDPAGNLTSFQVEGGGKTIFQYDRCHRRLAITDPLGERTLLKRDALGRIIERRGSRGEVVGFTYDPDGLPVKITHDGQEVGRLRYDGGGRLEGISDENGTVTFEYDQGGRFKRVVHPGGQGFSTTFNAAGLIESITYPGDLIVRYAYDSRQRPAKIAWPGGWVKYSYDAAGNLLEEIRSNGTESSYQYDNNERLITLKHSRGGVPFIERRYLRNAIGAIREEEGLQPLAPPPDQDLHCSSNAAGQIAGGDLDPFRYDADGNLVAGPGWEADYDAENRLVELIRNGIRKKFHYNVLDQRVQTETGGRAGNSCCHDPQGNLMYEVSAGGKVERLYLYCHCRPVAMIDGGGEVRFYHYDQGGNTLALTGSDGALVATYAYSPFGRCLSSGETGGNPFTFSGAYGVIDEGEGLYFMKRRYYSAQWGRFLQKDPLGFAGGTNPYVYAANNPINFIDPDGTLLVEAWLTWKTIGLAVGVGTSIYYTYKTYNSSYNTVNESSNSMEAVKKANKAYEEYKKICEHYGQFGGWDAKEAAYRKYEKAFNEIVKHHNSMCDNALETGDNLAELAKNAVTPDALSLPVAIYDYTNKDSGTSDPCRGGKPTGINAGGIKQKRLHY